MLFSVADGHLENEDYEEALGSAGDALAVFRKISNMAGVADTQRLIIHAYRGMAANERNDGFIEKSLNLLAEGENIAYDQLDMFSTVVERRGQAAMNVALAELKCDRDVKYCEESLDLVEDALVCFGELGDIAMEAMTCIVLSKVRLKMKHILAAKRAGNDAITLFRKQGNSKQEAIAWGNLGTIAAMDFCYEEAVRCGRKQVKLAQDIASKRLQADALHNIAHWSLCKGDWNAALVSASNSVTLRKELDDRRGWEVATVGLIVEAHISRNNPQEAVAVAFESVKRFRNNGNSRQAIRALHSLVLAHHANLNYEEALRAAQEAIDKCSGLNLKTLHSHILETLAHVHVEMQNFTEAKQAALDAVGLLNGIGATEVECKARMFLLARICVQIEEYGEAVKASNDALKIARDVGDRPLEGQAMLALCVTQGMAKNYDKALKAGELAAEVFHEVGGNFKIDEAKAWQTMAELHMAIGELSQALRCSVHAETLLQTFGDQRRLAKMKHTRVKIHMLAEEFIEATKAAMESLKISRSEDDLPGIVQSIFFVIEANVETLIEAGATDKPRRVFQQLCERTIRFAKEAIGVSVKLGAKRSEGSAYAWVSHLQIMAGRLPEAKQAAETALSLFQDVGDKAGQAHAIFLTASADLQSGERAAAAAEDLRRALALAQEAKDEQLIASIREQLERLAGSAGSRAAAAASAAAPVMADSAAEAAAAASQQQAGGGGAAELYTAPDPDIVKSFIINLVQNMTGSADEVDGDTPLMESGIDSLASVELRTQLQQEFRLNLPSTVMFNYPTITTMTQLLVDECSSKKITWDR